jgi:hypothetical protein
MSPGMTENPHKPASPDVNEFRDLAWATPHPVSVLLPNGLVQLHLEGHLTFDIADLQRRMCQTGLAPVTANGLQPFLGQSFRAIASKLI